MSDQPLLPASDAAVEAALALLGEASDDQLQRALVVLGEVQLSRAQSRGDLDALIELGFAVGFDASGKARAPWIVEGIIICPGSVLERSATSHECTFVHVGESWVWECEELALDEVRRGVLKGKGNQRSVSLLGAIEGLELDLISSKKRQGVHAMSSVVSYKVNGGALEVVSTRTPKADRHR